MFIKDIGFQSSFFKWCLLFWYQANDGFAKFAGKFTHVQSFGRYWEGWLLSLGISFFSKTIRFWALFCWEILVSDSIILLIIDLSNFSIASWFSLNILCISKSIFILFVFAISWHVIVRNSLLLSLYFFGISCDLFSFNSDFYLFIVSFSLLVPY